MIQDFTAWIYSLFNSCSEYESLIVTDIYEGLEEKAKSRLMAHISVCKKCRKNYEEISNFVGKIERAKEIVLDSVDSEEIDLLPQIKSVIEERESAIIRPTIARLRIPLAVGLSFAILMFVLWTYGRYTGENDLNFKSTNLAENSIVSNKGVIEDEPLKRQKEKLMNIIEKYKGQDFAGEALLMLADIEYSTEEKYDEAHKLYTELRNYYPHIFSSSPQAIYRYNLLEEVSNEAYKPLYVLNSSLSNSKEPIQQLENIVKRYPGRLVAQLAVQKMLECYGDDKSLSVDKQIALLENLKTSLSDPAVVAQVDYILGNLYWKQKSDFKQAERLFESVYHSGPPSLKPMAHDALMQLVSYSE